MGKNKPVALPATAYHYNLNILSSKAYLAECCDQYWIWNISRTQVLFPARATPESWLIYKNERSTCTWNDSASLSKIIFPDEQVQKIKGRENLLQSFQIERCEITYVSSGLWILPEIPQIILIAEFLNWNFSHLIGLC